MKHDLYIPILKTDPKAAITVVNDSTNKNIVCNATGSYLISKYGSIEQFFNSLGDAGIKKITLFLRRKNGTNYVPAKDGDGNIEYYSFDFAENDETPNPPKQEAAETIQKEEIQNFGLKGSLNAPENIYKLMHYSKLEKELEAANDRANKYKTRVKELEEAEMLEKIRKASAQGTTDMLNGAMDKAPGIITAITGLLKAKSGTVAAEMTGLGNPAPTAAPMSALKSQLIAYIQQTDDDTAGYLLSLVSAFGNDDFETQLDELLKKFNLIAA